ncbi:MAG TPA: ABC transporter permease, partial [Casimicrobium huifangae]|nr:ABC transporter permease [Casimicrobium huifangae]
MKRLLPPVMVAILLLGLWQWWVMAYDIPPFLVPSPLLVMKTLAKDWPLLSGSLLVTLKVTFLALVASVVIGVAVAFAFVQSRWIETAFFPYAVLLQVTPIVAIAPLIIIWVQSPTLSLVICAT